MNSYSNMPLVTRDKVVQSASWHAIIVGVGTLFIFHGCQSKAPPFFVATLLPAIEHSAIKTDLGVAMAQWRELRIALFKQECAERIIAETTNQLPNGNRTNARSAALRFARGTKKYYLREPDPSTHYPPGLFSIAMHPSIVAHNSRYAFVAYQSSTTSTGLIWNLEQCEVVANLKLPSRAEDIYIASLASTTLNSPAMIPDSFFFRFGGKDPRLTVLNVPVELFMCMMNQCNVRIERVPDDVYGEVVLIDVTGKLVIPASMVENANRGARIDAERLMRPLDNASIKGFIRMVPSMRWAIQQYDITVGQGQFYARHLLVNEFLSPGNMDSRLAKCVHSIEANTNVGSTTVTHFETLSTEEQARLAARCFLSGLGLPEPSEPEHAWSETVKWVSIGVFAVLCLCVGRWLLSKR